MRGWTRSCGKAAGIFCVYPAYAGMDPRGTACATDGGSLPRIRGDGPYEYASALHS